MPSLYDFALYEVACKAILKKQNNILLLLTNKGHYDFPGGRMDKSEMNLKLNVVLEREIEEELGNGVKFKINNVAFVCKRYFKRDNLEHHILAIYYLVDYISGDIKVSDEHTEYKWIEPKSIFNEPIKFQSDSEYLEYKNYFS